jgi:hypothetical protein
MRGWFLRLFDLVGRLSSLGRRLPQKIGSDPSITADGEGQQSHAKIGIVYV